MRLLNIEWSKFKNNAVVKMLLWVYAIAFPTVIFIGKEKSISLPPMINRDVFYKFPTVWDWLGYDGNWMTFFCLGFIVVHIVGIERSYKTMRQNIITGMTRMEFFISKLQVVVLLSVLATIYYLIVGFLIGWFSTPNVDLSIAMDSNWAGIRFFLMTFGYLTFAMMIGFLIKNSGLAVLTYLAYGILLEPLIRYQFHGRLFNGISKHYYPLNAMEDLMPMPFLRMNLNSAAEGARNLLNYTEAYLLTIGYILLFLYITYFYFKKADL